VTTTREIFVQKFLAVESFFFFVVELLPIAVHTQIVRAVRMKRNQLPARWWLRIISDPFLILPAFADQLVQTVWVDKVNWSFAARIFLCSDQDVVFIGTGCLQSVTARQGHVDDDVTPVLS
jgi:hypothetical protein